MEKNTPEQILLYLKDHSPAIAGEIADKLHLTQADIRYHLKRLVDMGLVVGMNPTLKGTRGRPARYFRLPEGNHPVAIDSLLTGLLDEITFLSSDERGSSLRRLAARIFRFQEVSSPSFAIRMAHLLGTMNGMGYQARWEIRQGCSSVELQACPYRTLIDRYPILCELDRIALESAARTQVDCITRIAGGFSHSCEFEIGGK